MFTAAVHKQELKKQKRTSFIFALITFLNDLMHSYGYEYSYEISDVQ